MYSSQSGRWLTSLVTPLGEKFGDRLTVRRSADTICWGYDGQSACAEFSADGRLWVTFLDVEGCDAVAGLPAAAAYRTGARYSLDAPGCRSMVADVLDFFSGVREPRFTFVDVLAR